MGSVEENLEEFTVLVTGYAVSLFLDFHPDSLIVHLTFL